MTTTLTLVGTCLSGCGFFALLTPGIKRTDAWALLATGASFQAISHVRQGNFVWACFDASAAAFFIYFWWNNGGGDDTKRRLKSAAKKFRPVRRTAPAGGAAYLATDPIEQLGEVK